MNKLEIDLNAKRVWRLLGDHNRWSFEKLLKVSELSEFDLQIAIGWLANENKIEFERTSNGYYCFTGVNVYIG